MTYVLTPSKVNNNAVASQCIITLCTIYIYMILTIGRLGIAISSKQSLVITITPTIL
jgi:hypothetical protein